jgi:hypothetical protein
MTDRGSYRDAGESIRHRVEEMRRSAPSARVVLTPLRRAALPPQVTVELERLFGLLGQDVSDAAGLAGIEVLLRELEDQIAVATSALERAKSRLVKHVAVPRGPRVPWWLPSMLEAPMHHVLRHRLQHHDAKARSWLPSTDAAFASFTDGDTPLLLLGRTTAERGKLGAVREDDSEFALRVPVLDGFALTVTPRAQFERLLRRVGEPFGLGALPARADTEFDSCFACVAMANWPKPCCPSVFATGCA